MSENTSNSQTSSSLSPETKKIFASLFGKTEAAQREEQIPTSNVLAEIVKFEHKTINEKEAFIWEFLVKADEFEQHFENVKLTLFKTLITEGDESKQIESAQYIKNDICKSGFSWPKNADLDDEMIKNIKEDITGQLLELNVVLKEWQGKMYQNVYIKGIFSRDKIAAWKNVNGSKKVGSLPAQVSADKQSVSQSVEEITKGMFS